MLLCGLFCCRRLHAVELPQVMGLTARDQRAGDAGLHQGAVRAAGIVHWRRHFARPANVPYLRDDRSISSRIAAVNATSRRLRVE